MFKYTTSLTVPASEKMLKMSFNDMSLREKMKLNLAIGIFSKLTYNDNLSVLKIIYHSLFDSHLLYVSQIWGKRI